MLGEVFFNHDFSQPIPLLTINSLPVFTFYSKESGGGSRHAWQASTTTISALSYLVVQTFERMVTQANRFRSIHRNKANIRAETYLHIPSAHFLCRHQKTVTFVDPQTLLVDDKDWATFQKMSKCIEALGPVIKGLIGATKGGKRLEACTTLAFPHYHNIIQVPRLPSCYFFVELTVIIHRGQGR
jgi:hypothetical protein